MVYVDTLTAWQSRTIRKSANTLAVRGLDFKDASVLFDGVHFETEDIRKDYGEVRMLCFGMLRDRMVVAGYTPRGADRPAIQYEESQ